LFSICVLLLVCQKLGGFQAEGIFRISVAKTDLDALQQQVFLFVEPVYSTRSVHARVLCVVRKGFHRGQGVITTSSRLLAQSE
jgi:hypothetical protein